MNCLVHSGVANRDFNTGVESRRGEKGRRGLKSRGGVPGRDGMTGGVMHQTCLVQ